MPFVSAAVCYNRNVSHGVYTYTCAVLIVKDVDLFKHNQYTLTLDKVEHSALIQYIIKDSMKRLSIVQSSDDLERASGSMNRVLDCINMGDGTVELVVRPLERITIKSVVQRMPYILANVVNFREDMSPEKEYLIGTNILTLGNTHVPTFFIESGAGTKYKAEIRRFLKKEYGMKSDVILGIKHIHNCGEFHNYLILIDESAFKKKLPNTNSYEYTGGVGWRTFYELYKPTCVNPVIRDIYTSFGAANVSKAQLKSKHIFKLKLGDTGEILKMDDIYAKLSVIL